MKNVLLRVFKKKKNKIDKKRIKIYFAILHLACKARERTWQRVKKLGSAASRAQPDDYICGHRPTDKFPEVKYFLNYVI